ncbi:MAG TPA: sensor histidine kinase N-terminal domain-containing protein, partial [Burkholderiales bacterium]|nr:sensor histidine kinase N-terminal domain-containing protein [Burkholderiales bacterium]
MPFSKSEGRGSLFVEILDWMLVPLLLVWPVSVVVTYLVAQPIAGAPYDQALTDHARALAVQVRWSGGSTEVNLPAAAGALLRADDVDEVYFQVRDPAGQVIAGDRELAPVTRSPDLVPEVIYHRDAKVREREVRVAYLFLPAGSGYALVQVGETTNKRDALAREIITGVVLPQFILVPLAVVMVWIGLSRGLAPLSDLQRSIRARSPSDMSPVDESTTPFEIRPLIHSINDLMGRVDRNLKAQQRFVGDAAHQMRTPLAGLRTQAELALRLDDASEIRESLRQVVASTERTQHLVTQLLMLARAEAPEESRPPFEAVDVNQLTRGCVEEWLPHADAKRIDLGYEDAGWAARVHGNPSLLREMVGNLLDNAIRYTPCAGRVTARVIAADRVVVEVEDNGPGVDEADRELVFQRFFRVLGTGVEGSGLGLAIVRSIAHQHQASAVLLPAPGGQ